MPRLGMGGGGCSCSRLLVVIDYRVYHVIWNLWDCLRGFREEIGHVVDGFLGPGAA